MCVLRDRMVDVVIDPDLHPFHIHYNCDHEPPDREPPPEQLAKEAASDPRNLFDEGYYDGDF